MLNDREEVEGIGQTLFSAARGSVIACSSYKPPRFWLRETSEGDAENGWQ